MWTQLLELRDTSTKPRDGKNGPKGHVLWPETIIEQEEEEKTGCLWLGYPEMDQQEWAQVALAQLSVQGTRHAFEETLQTRGSGH